MKKKQHLRIPNLAPAITLLLWLLLMAPAGAQPYGGIADSLLTMNPPEVYPIADAVVLFDSGKTVVELNGMDFTRHTRLKIFTDTGLAKVREVEIEYFAYDQLEDLRALIYKPNGRIIEFKEEAFEVEKAGTRRLCRFSFGDAEPGDVLEYSYRLDFYTGLDKLGLEKILLFSQDQTYREYRKHTEHLPRIVYDSDTLRHIGNLPSWLFDNPVFTLSSRYIAQLGADVDYMYYTTNLPSHEAEPEMERIELLLATVYKKYTWDMRNVLPFKPDPERAVEREAQRRGLHFRLLTVQGQRLMKQGRFSKKHWQNVGESMQGYYNEYTKRTRHMTREVNALTREAGDSRADIRTLYEYVVDEYDIDSTGYILRPRHNNLNDLFKAHGGMPFELNILLVEFLRIAEFDAWPVLISTRDRIDFRKSGKFNHILAMVTTGSDTLFLDASVTNCPPGTLPLLSRVAEGIQVNYDESQPVNIVADSCTSQVKY